MKWAIILIIWTVVAALAGLALGRMFPREPDPPPSPPEPDWSAEDPRIVELSRHISRARASHGARAHWTRELCEIRTQRLREQFQRRRA